MPRPCHHRDLHSFPTRRSSDLATEPGRYDLAALPRTSSLLDERHRVGEGAFDPRSHPPALPGRAAVDGAEHSVFGLDRKSTRLNSSHMSISYAVFCLKKKSQ